MALTGSSFLIFAAALSAIAALAHVGVVLGGPDWYRFFGAGEGMARLAAQGSWYPVVVTLGVASVLALWSAYALSGAGVLPRLPLLKLALVGISVIYTLRGVAGFVLAYVAPGGNSPTFWMWSSVICLFIGLVHVFGVYKVWPSLTPN